MTLSRALHRRMERRDDKGMTLIELTVTLALTSIVMAMVTYILVQILQETTGESASVKGVEQAQIAERTFTQYLRSAVSLVNIQTNDLTFTSYAGTASGVPQVETIEAELCESVSSNVDYLEVIYGLSSSSTGVHICSTTTTTTVALPANARLVESFDITPPTAGNDIFTYYQYTGTGFTPVRLDECRCRRSVGGGRHQGEHHVPAAPGQHHEDVPHRARDDAQHHHLPPEFVLRFP